MAWNIVWPDVHSMVYDMAWRVWDIYLDIRSYCVLNVDQAFVVVNTCKYQLQQWRQNEDSYSAYPGWMRVPLVNQMKYVCNRNRRLQKKDSFD